MYEWVCVCVKEVTWNEDRKVDPCMQRPTDWMMELCSVFIWIYSFFFISIVFPTCACSCMPTHCICVCVCVCVSWVVTHSDWKPRAPGRERRGPGRSRQSSKQLQSAAWLLRWLRGPSPCRAEGKALARNPSWEASSMTEQNNVLTPYCWQQRWPHSRFWATGRRWSMDIYSIWFVQCCHAAVMNVCKNAALAAAKRLWGTGNTVAPP